jgi:hypothetical protein
MVRFRICTGTDVERAILLFRIASSIKENTNAVFTKHDIQLVNTQPERPIESVGLYNLAKELADIIKTMLERSKFQSRTCVTTPVLRKRSFG